MSPEDQRTFDSWISANAIFGAVHALGILGAVAGSNAPGPDAAIVVNHKASNVVAAVKLAASFWNNVGAGMVIGGMAAAFFLDKPPGAWTKIAIAMAGLVLGWVCYSIAQQHVVLFAYSTRRPAVKGRPLNRALHGNAEKQPY